MAREERRARSIRSLRQRWGLWLLVGASSGGPLRGHLGWHAGWWYPFCTVAGPMGGHQLWPWMQPRLPSSSAHAAGEGRAVPSELATPSELALRVAVWFLYLLLVGVGVVSFRGETLPESPPLPACRRGRLPLLLLTVLTPSFLPHLWWRWGAEFGSIWCWGASAAMLAALAEPMIARWAHRCHRSSLSAHKHWAALVERAGVARHDDGAGRCDRAAGTRAAGERKFSYELPGRRLVRIRTPRTPSPPPSPSEPLSQRLALLIAAEDAVERTYAYPATPTTFSEVEPHLSRYIVSEAKRLRTRASAQCAVLVRATGAAAATDLESLTLSTPAHLQEMEGYHRHAAREAADGSTLLDLATTPPASAPSPLRGICEHGRQRSQCKECGGVASVSTGGGAAIARSAAADASASTGGAQDVQGVQRQRICEHRRRRSDCRSAAAAASVSTGGIATSARSAAAGHLRARAAAQRLQGARRQTHLRARVAAHVARSAAAAVKGHPSRGDGSRSKRS